MGAYAYKLEAQLHIEVAELQRRETRLEKITEVKAELEQRAAKRYAQQQADYEAKMKEREDKEKKRGRKLDGKVPTPPEPGPQAKDQANFTDGDSRVMPTASGFEQAYNAQASVDMATMLIVGQHVSQNTNDIGKLKSISECLKGAQRAKPLRSLALWAISIIHYSQKQTVRYYTYFVKSELKIYQLSESVFPGYSVRFYIKSIC